MTRLIKVVRSKGLSGIDKRSSGWRAVQEFRENLIADLGGINELSTQQLALVDLSARSWLFLNEIDGFLLKQERLVVGRGRTQTILPVLQQRQGIASTFESTLARLGLSRRTAREMSVSDYIESKAEKTRHST